MDVRCDRCETEYELDDAIVTDAGASVQCTTCGHTFIVTRRPSSPLHQMGLTPPSGTKDLGDPAVPEWTFSTDDGKVHRFRDLTTLQKWIVERKVGRTERISRSGGPWLSLGDVAELTPFFNVVDEADRARASAGISGGMPTPPTFPSAAGWASVPAPRTPSGPVRFLGGSPPPVPAEARRPISEDGPTVPNRMLPGSEALPLPLPLPPPQPVGAPDVPRIPLPGVRGSSPSIRRAPEVRASNGSGVHASSGPASKPAAADNEGVRVPSAARPARDALVVGPNITTETHALESDFLRPHRGRNAVLAALALLLAGAGGGYWWWLQNGHASAPSAAATSDSPPPVTDTNQRSGAALIVARTPADSRSAASGPGADNAARSPTAVGGTTGAVVGARVGAGGAAAPTSAGPGSGASPRGRSPGSVRTADGTAVAGRGGGASYERLVAEGDRLLEHGKSAKADKAYAQALALRSDGVAALTGSAYVLLDRQRHFKAIETFRRALAIEPSFAPARFGIAESYRARGDTAQALGAYRQYLEIAPSGTDASAARRQIKDLESVGGASAPGTDRASTQTPTNGQDQ